MKEAVDDEIDDRIVEAAALTREALSAGGSVWAIGNGGSASDAEHFAAELWWDASYWSAQGFGRRR